MELWQGAFIFILSILAGFLNVLAGGGSLLTVPVMVFMGIPGPVANGTNRIGILTQNIASVIAFFRKGYSDFRLSLTLSVMTIPGAVAGAYLGTRLEGVWFNRVLAIIMLGIMLVMAFDNGSSVNRTGEQVSRKRMIIGHLLMIGVGFYGGFIQIGVGFLVIPVLNRVMGIDLVRVNMHKVFIAAVYTVVALAIFAARVEILWLLGACLGVGNAIGGWLGTHAAISKGEKLIRIVLYSVLVAFVIKLLFFS